MRRELFDQEHEDYRFTVRSFLERNVVPHYEKWEENGFTERSVFGEAWATGVCGLTVPEELGGPGIDDYRFRVVVCEETARARVTALQVSFTHQDDMLLPYLLDLCTDDQKERWVRGLASGDLIGAVAMSEPGAGSDLRSIRTRAVRDGDDWILTGEKTFITHGILADFVVVAAQTESDGENAAGLTLFVVEEGMTGFERGRALKKVGLRAQDTAELFFDRVRVPEVNVLGDVGRGLAHLKRHLVRERLGTSVCAVADARAVYDLTVDYVFQREAFGQRIGDFQATRFALAEMETEIDIAETYQDRLVQQYGEGEVTPSDAAKAKWWTTELQRRVVDRCVQLHGGYGYMVEYAVARAYMDSRVQTIYGGTTEIMKEIIGRGIASRSSAGR
jgi:alkylation response protein AidB-like acyl-CoA dehydrogenase